MRTTSLLFLLLMVTCLIHAQEAASPTPLKMGKGKPKVYAVVVGISDYQNEGIPDLRFAHRDALAFVDYLQSKAGGNVPEDQMMVLINEEATTAQIAAAMDWLIEVTQEGDQAMIYFSGHGDVETKTAMQHGFLLTYDSPPTTYIAGAYPLFYLQSVVSTLSTQKKAQVLLITDACHSGKLAGSSVSGTQVTTAALAKQFANEIKIMSCQPNEFSMEGEQWGGGRGAFSFHLIDGLTGMADHNEDLQVNLLELERYLEDKVPAEVAPQSQIPMVLGSKGTSIAYVDTETLDRLIAAKQDETPLMASADSRGIEDEVLAKADEPTRQLYADFKKALETGNLLSPPENSGYGLYEKLVQKESLVKLHSTIKRNLAVAFQEEAQQAINAYLRADSAEMAQLYAGDEKYSRFPQYLNKASSLLGDKHYMFNALKAKQLYFEGLIMRLDVEKNGDKGGQLDKALQMQEKALEYQERAPFVYSEMGILYRRQQNLAKAAIQFKKAIELAPSWLVPQSMLIKTYLELQRYEEAKSYAEKTKILAEEFPGVSPRVLRNIMTDLGIALAFLKEYDQAESQFQSMLDEDPDNVAALVSLGWINWARSRWTIAHEYLKRAIHIVPDDPEVVVMLGDVCFFTGKFEEGTDHYLKVIEMDPADVVAVAKLCFLYLHNNQTREAERLLKDTREVVEGPNANLDVVQAFIYRNNERYMEAMALLEKVIQPGQVLPIILPQTMTLLGYTLQDLSQFDQAEQVYLKTHEMGQEHYWPKYCLARLYAQQGKKEQAMDWLKKSLESGGPWYERLVKDPFLRKLRKMDGYKALLSQYFPEEVKDK